MRDNWGLFFCFILFSNLAQANSIYQLEFKSEAPLDFTYELYELPATFEAKVGTEGTIDDVRQLTALREIKNLKVEFGPTQTNILLGLVVRSKSKKKADFFVSPHQTSPASAGLNFRFNCLCYHHVYHLEKGKIWYRVMKLNNLVALNSKEIVLLQHSVIPWTKKKGELNK